MAPVKSLPKARVALKWDVGWGATWQATAKVEKNDVFYFEDEDDSGWYGVGYGSYATMTQSSNERKALFEDIMRQAEDRLS